MPKKPKLQLNVHELDEEMSEDSVELVVRVLSDILLREYIYKKKGKGEDDEGRLKPYSLLY